jgi:sterol 14-demethylase
MIRGVTSDLQIKKISLIHKRLAAVQKSAPLGDRESYFLLALQYVNRDLLMHLVIPIILEDSRRTMETWGTSGTFNPFEKIYEVSFSLLSNFLPHLLMKHHRQHCSSFSG